MNFAAHEVAVAGVPVELTATEYRLLAVLVRHRGQVLSPVKLLELVWSDPFGIGPDRVKYSVMRLRRKLGAAGGADTLIEAVRGFGYRYRVAPAGPARPAAPQPSSTGGGHRLAIAARAHCRRHAFLTSPRSPGAPAEPAGRGRVLIVEDDPEAALFATPGPRQRGRFDVTHTADPAVALVLAASGPWDLVLTDMDLPVMSGMDLLAALRQLAPSVPVLLVTASPQAFAAPLASAGSPAPAPAGPTACSSSRSAPSTLLSAPPSRWPGQSRPLERPPA